MVAWHAIRPRKERGAEFGGHESRRSHVGADVGMDQGAQAEDAPLAVEAHLDLVVALSRVVRRHQALATVLDPPDRTAELHGRERHQDVLRVELAANAEASSHVYLGQPQRAERNPEDRGQDAAVRVDALGRADQVKLSALGIGRHGDEPPRLEGRGGLPGIDKPLADDHRRRVDRRIDVADSHRDQGDVIGLGAGEQQGRALSERFHGARAGGQRIVDDVDEPERVLGDVAVIGHHQGDRLSRVPDDPAGDSGLEVALGPGRRSHAVGDDGAPRHVGGREHGAHACQLERAPGVDGYEPGVGVAGAEHHRVEHAGHADIGHEAPRSCRESISADTVVRRADHGLLLCDERPRRCGRAVRAEAIAWLSPEGKGSGRDRV